MQIIDVGSGPPIVLIPGVQGRWEWMKPAVDHLARRCRVITFSLADEPSSGGRFATPQGFDNYVRQVGDAMDAAGLARACVCGVSYGGLIATVFAVRYPERVSGLVLVSALPPSWTPDARVRRYARTPWLLLPLFSLGSLRLYPEFLTAAGSVPRSITSALRHLTTVLTHPFSPVRMARRVSLWTDSPIDRGALRVEAPTLVVTGEPGLDRVVPTWLTREYLERCPHAESAVLERTGHLGLITRPDAFAGIVGAFVERCADTEGKRRIG